MKKRPRVLHPARVALISMAAPDGLKLLYNTIAGWWLVRS
jgi:hypothetical protein